MTHKFFEPGFIGDVTVRSTCVRDTTLMGPFLVVELEVETSNTEDHPVGSTGAWLQQLSEPGFFAWHLAYWVAACSGYGNDEPEKIMPLVGAWEQTLSEIRNRSDYLVDKRMHLQTLSVTTRNGIEFTRYLFSPARQ